MSQFVLYFIILALLIPLWIKLHRDYVSGLCYAIIVLVACTHLLRIPTPGSLPELTIHRLVILSLLVVWIANRDRNRRLGEVPLANYILIWAAIAFVSLIASVDYVAGIKRYLDYVLEFFLLYFIVSTSLRDREDAIRILRSVCVGVAIVAALAIFERYTRINVVDRFIGYDSESGIPVRDIRATYRHRILLGAGMAMGWPLAFYFFSAAKTKRGKGLAGTLVLALLAACYFSMSRGPWVAAALAGGFIAVFGTALTRKRIGFLLGFMVLFLLLRPGVYNTILTRAEATLHSDSFKGGTFQYRWELWKVAGTEVSKNPWRFLFGYGPGSGANQSLEWELSFRDEGNENIESWDNDLAYSLFQYGFVGLIATMVLYAAIPWRLLRHARQITSAERDLYVCLAASALVLFFMMSNVMIFTRQLYYMLWTVTAAGFVLMRDRSDFTPNEKALREIRVEEDLLTVPRKIDFRSSPANG